ncbi:MAG: glycosyl transferase [Marinilabiliales bacterium]|nr:MAG: glycosyl transferase [Marinilabiliales bacterium]
MQISSICVISVLSKNTKFAKTPELKILVYRLSSIGDIVLTTPVVRNIRKKYPEAEIHFLTRKKYADLLGFNPYIDKLVTVEHAPKEILQDLQAEKYDYFIDLHRNIRSKALKKKLWAKYSTFPKHNFKKYLYTRFKIQRMPGVHIVDRYMMAVQHLSVQNDDEGLDLFINENVSLPKLAHKEFITFAIGATFNTKRYPFDQVASFIAIAPLPVYILGGPDEEETGARLEAESNGKAVSWCGNLSLQQSAEMIRQSKLCISNDTGMMHFAAALQKPLISIWGSTVPAFGMYPYYPKSMQDKYIIMEVLGLKCRPCSKLGFKECPKKHFKCMKEITPDHVLKATEALLKNSGS